MYVSNYNMVFDINQEGRQKEKILYNQLSQSMDIVSVEMIHLMELLKNDKVAGDMVTQKLDYLFERGYCYHDKKQEDQKIESEYGKARQMHQYQPITFLLSPTYACNLRCSYCFQQYMDVKYKPVSMTPEIVEKAVEFIESRVLTPDRIFTPLIYLYGGEPFMKAPKYKQITDLIIDKCKEFQIPLGAVTNGVYLREYIRSLKDVNVFELKVTLNGSKRVHDKVRIDGRGQGTYDIIMENLQMAIDNGFPVTVNGVGNLDMYQSLPDLVEDFDKRGWLKLDRSKFRFQSQHECSDLFVDHFNALESQNVSQTGKDAMSSLSQDYQSVIVNTLKMLTDIGNTNSKTQQVIMPECKGVQYIYQNGQVPPPSFFCATTHQTWSLDAYGKLFVCLGCTGDQGASVGTFYPEIKIDQTRLDNWSTSKNIFDISKCQDCKVKFTCAGGCARLKVPADPVDPPCEPIQELLQIGFDYYLPRIEARWKKDSWQSLEN